MYIAHTHTYVIYKIVQRLYWGRSKQRWNHNLIIKITSFKSSCKSAHILLGKIRMNYKWWCFLLCCLSGVSELIWHKKELKWEPAFEDRSTVLAVKRRPGLRQDIEVHPVFMPRHAVWEQLGFWLLLGTMSSFPSLARDSQHKLTLEDFFQSVKMIRLSPCLWLLGMLGNQLWGISWNQGWC